MVRGLAAGEPQLSHVSGAARSQARPLGLPHSAGRSHQNSTATSQAPSGLTAPDHRAPSHAQSWAHPGAWGTGKARSPGGRRRGPGDAYRGRSCRPRGAGSRVCTRKGRSLACSRTCDGSRHCAPGTHPHLGGDRGPRVNGQYPPRRWPPGPQRDPSGRHRPRPRCQDPDPRPSPSGQACDSALAPRPHLPGRQSRVGGTLTHTQPTGRGGEGS